MLKDIFGSLGFVIVGSDILFWAYFFLIMDKVSVFESSDFGELRIIVDPKGDVWFVASDVAKSLGYVNAKDAIKRHVDNDDSMLLQVSDNQWGVNQSLLKTRYIDSIRIINESGLYSLILSSKLESAKRFKKWVTSEVLPSIRKTGEYKTSSGGKGILVPDFSNPADAARAWADQYEAAQRAMAEKSQAEAEKQPEIKDIFEKCGAKKPDKATWGDVQYVFAMYYSDGFPKVFKCENELVKATLMYLDDPDAPEGVAFIRWLAVQDYLGEKINWKDLT
nr:MAG: hypothetical protein [Bacteriophage sp.]